MGLAARRDVCHFGFGDEAQMERACGSKSEFRILKVPKSLVFFYETLDHHAG
jgi:hypothetical protein